jgi:hypothetical protein
VKTLAPVHRLEMQLRTWELAWHYATALRRKGTVIPLQTLDWSAEIR